MLPVKTILHPTDFSPEAQSAFDVALALARDYGARLILFHVTEIPTTVSGEYGVLPVVWEENEKLVAQKAAELKKASTPIPTEWITSEGDPALEIEELASNMKCDLIVMGSHGRSGLARLLMGSVAEHVVRKAECPVLIIKKPVPAAAVAQLEPVAAGCDARPDTEC